MQQTFFAHVHSWVGLELFDFQIEHGDVYILNEKATGFDWRMSSRHRLVHGAGAAAYVTPKVAGNKRKDRE